MCPNWFGLLVGFSSLDSILFYFKSFSLLVIQQAKSVNKYIVTLATTVDVVIGINGHVITVTYSCLVILDMGGEILNASSCLILVDNIGCVNGC